MTGPFKTSLYIIFAVHQLGYSKKDGCFQTYYTFILSQREQCYDFIDAKFTKVNYSSFDNIVNSVKRLGKDALCGEKI